MTISFNDIPSTQRIPFTYVEFDSSRAVKGPLTQPFKVLIIGQKTSAGTATVEVPIQVRPGSQSRTLFGPGSQLHHMCEAFFENNETSEVWVIPLADLVAGTLAAGKFAITGPATAAGTLAAYIGGKVVQVAVGSTDSASTVATALAAAITADADLPVTASANSGDVTVTAKNKGLEGNFIDLRVNYYSEDALPTGLAVTITPMATGTGNPDADDALDVMGSVQYNALIHPWTDEANIDKITLELDDRWGPLTQRDGHAFTGTNVSYADSCTLGNKFNSKHSTIVSLPKSPTLPWEIGAAIGAVVSYYSPIDPARPIQNLAVQGILPPAAADKITDAERNLLLYAGISTLKIGTDGTVYVERLITNYQTNAYGAEDTAYLDLEPKLTLSYLRYDFRNWTLTKYPRHKVADDGTRFGPGQAILTPKTFKAAVVGWFREKEEMGLVEGVDQFKDDLVVERNIADPTRLDTLMSPDLVNQLRIMGVQIQYLL